MQAAEYFERVRSMERELRRRCWMVASAEEKLDMIKGALGCGRGGGDPSWRVAEVVEAWTAHVDLLRASVDALVDCEHEAYEYTRKMKDSPNGDNMRDVLQSRYICLKDNDEIAATMGVSKKTVQNWVSAAFEWFDSLRLFDREPPKHLL